MLTIANQKAKLSAGLLLFSGKRILLLKRASLSPNGDTWGLPGGQCHPHEPPFQAAFREAEEEIGAIPRNHLIGSVAVQRSHRRYEIFAIRAKKRTRKGWAPQLNQEHSSFRWVNYKWCLRHRDELHPVLRQIFKDESGIQWVLNMRRHHSSVRIRNDRRSEGHVRVLA
ncbi:MAG: NUDIX hydrolase [Planctomycetota bacterium]|nr:NUDIX hydrolase [Planctomycetota bacterium]